MKGLHWCPLVIRPTHTRYSDYTIETGAGATTYMRPQGITLKGAWTAAGEFNEALLRGSGLTTVRDARGAVQIVRASAETEGLHKMSRTAAKAMATVKPPVKSASLRELKEERERLVQERIRLERIRLEAKEMETLRKEIEEEKKRLAELVQV